MSNWQMCLYFRVSPFCFIIHVFFFLLLLLLLFLSSNTEVVTVCSLLLSNSTEGVNVSYFRAILTQGNRVFLKTRQMLNYSRISQHFLESEGSQEPCTGPYPQPDESIPYHPLLFL
jgi:hypothetical protein